MKIEIVLIILYVISLLFLIGYNVYLDCRFNKMIDKYFEDRHRFNAEILKLKLECKK